MKKLLFPLTLFILAAGCKKFEEEIVPGNTAPPDKTISNVTVENYVNKTYISVLGRKPDSTEFAQGVAVLKAANLSQASRSQFLDSVFSEPEYKDHVYDIARAELLNNQDTAEIAFWLYIFNETLKDTSQKILWDYVQQEIKRLETLRALPADFKSGTIDVIEVHHRCVNNYFYDQINMGTENFVVSMFQNFLSRYPTEAELKAASEMVDGKNMVVFLQAGGSKDDFQSIFFNSDDYFEGQVIALYSRYLFRAPSSVEMSAAAGKYRSTRDYIQLQKDILSSNEYIGL